MTSHDENFRILQNHAIDLDIAQPGIPFRLLSRERHNQFCRQSLLLRKQYSAFLRRI